MGRRLQRKIVSEEEFQRLMKEAGFAATAQEPSAGTNVRKYGPYCVECGHRVVEHDAKDGCMFYLGDTNETHMDDSLFCDCQAALTDGGLENVKLYPYCLKHGAMLAVSKDGLYRCPECHIGWDRKTGAEINRAITTSDATTGAAQGEVKTK